MPSRYTDEFGTDLGWLDSCSVGLVLHWEDGVMPRDHPQGFRVEFVRSVHLGELTYSQIAKDFGIWHTCMSNWARRADVEEGTRAATSTAELREGRNNRPLKQLLADPEVDTVRIEGDRQGSTVSLRVRKDTEPSKTTILGVSERKDC